MEILPLIGSVILFAIFAIVVLFVLINISSRLALVVLFVTPILFVLLLPGTVISFLSIQHMLLADGLVPVNNFHILLMIWSTLIGIILYTEFLTWYLGKGRKTKNETQDLNKANDSFDTIQKNTSALIEKAKEGLLKRN